MTESKPEEVAVDPPRRRPRPQLTRRRLGIYAVALALGVAWALHQRRNPRDDVAGVVALARADRGVETFFVERGATLSFLRGVGYVLVLYVEDFPGFQPATYLTMSRLQGRRRGELIVEAGVKGVTVLEGAELASYLLRADLSLSTVDALYEDLYAEPLTSKR